MRERRRMMFQRFQSKELAEINWYRYAKNSSASFTITFTNWNQGTEGTFSNKPINVPKVGVGLQRENRYNTNHYLKLETASGHTFTYKPEGYYNKSPGSTRKDYDAATLTGVPGDRFTKIIIHDETSKYNNYHAWIIFLWTYV